MLALLGLLAGLPGVVAGNVRLATLPCALSQLAWLTGVALLAGRRVQAGDAPAAPALAATAEQADGRAPRSGQAGPGGGQPTRNGRTEGAVPYGILHDTVLATLTAIARGGLDHRTAEVRARCAREADHLRRLISGDPQPESASRGLARELSLACREAELLGMRVRCFTAALPGLPAPVVAAICGAVREALNNALAHSGTAMCWVTAVGDGGAVTVTVADRGRGFDRRPDGPGPAGGIGIRWSIMQRMADAGGTATVTSAPGSGTCVELRWPAR